MPGALSGFPDVAGPRVAERSFAAAQAASGALMQFYASREAEQIALRRAAARAHCVLRSVTLAPLDRSPSGVAISGAPHVVGRLECADGWGAARLLLALAVEDALTPGAKSLAAELRDGNADDGDFARAIHAFVLRRVKFEREAIEEFETAGYTLDRGAGDCDAHFRLVYAIAAAGGLRAGLGLLHHGTTAPRNQRGPAHAVAVIALDDKWEWCETTVAATFGEPPNDAARRLGLTSARTDLAKEIRIMTPEFDLPALPATFRERNDPAQVARDAQALQRLGYLAADEPAELLTDPTNGTLRQAVAAFQEASGLVRDGLLGPTTRLSIARALTEAGPPVTEGFDYPGIGALEEAVPVKLTGHLSPGFFRGVIAMAKRMRAGGATISDEALPAVWLAESGIRNIPNHQGYPYAGLNQMGPQERASAGFHGTMADWLALSCEAQLPYVERYYVNATGNNFRGMRDEASLYLVNFLPAFIGHAGEPDFILARIDPAGPAVNAPESEWAAWRELKGPDGKYLHRNQWYTANRGFDTRRDGTIRVRDMGTAVERAKGGKNAPYWAEVQARLIAEGGSPAPISVKGAARVGVVLAMLAVGGWAAYNAWAS